MDYTTELTHLCLCAGYDGIGKGLELAGFNIGFNIFVEVEAFSGACLVAKVEESKLAPGVLYPDLKTFPFGKFRGKIDILSAGFPCQPFSAAGQRRADDDPRHLWPFIRDGIDACRPSLVLLENVDGIVSARLGGDDWSDPKGTPVLLHVLRELERLGYRATAGCFTASEAGAPHQRKRWFIMAHNIGERIEELHRQISMESEQYTTWHRRHGWRRVSFASDCGIDEETGEIGDLCSICGGDYSDCECPGPTQDGYEYTEIDGIMYAKPEQVWPSRPGQPQFEWEPPRVV